MTVAAPADRSADPWAVLGLEPGASPEEVAKAWRALATRHHPDAGGDPEHFRRLVAARDEVARIARRRDRDGEVTVVHRNGRAAALLRPLRRRIDRHLHPRVN